MSEVSLRDHVLRVLDECKCYHEARLDAIQGSLDQGLANLHAKVDKTETLQLEYNRVHNDLLRRMDTLVKELVPRSEWVVLQRVNEEKIADLREQILAHKSVGSGIHAGWLYLLGGISLIGGIGGIVVIVLRLAGK